MTHTHDAYVLAINSRRMFRSCEVGAISGGSQTGAGLGHPQPIVVRTDETVNGQRRRLIDVSSGVDAWLRRSYMRLAVRVAE